MSPADGSGRALLVWQAGVGWDGLAGTDRHLVTHLLRHVDVLWVDPPRSVVPLVRSRAWASLWPRTTSPRPGLTRLHPVAPPFPDRPGVDRVTNALTSALVRRTLRRLGRRASVVVGTSPHPPLDPVAGARRVYYATDDFTAGAELMGKRRDRFRRVELRRVAEADVLGAVSPEILARWPTSGRRTFVLPNGCDLAHYDGVDQAPAPDDVALPPPVAGLVGQLSPRVDLGLLEAVADAGVSLLLVGPRHADFEPARVEALLARSNVVWVGQKPFAELPSYLRVIEVGLTPYVPDEFNRASFPLKTLEYLAAGRGVVSTALPAVDRLGSPWIRVAEGPDAFVRELRAAFRESATPGAAAARREYAAGHDWSARAATFLEAVGLAGAVVPRPDPTRTS